MGRRVVVVYRGRETAAVGSSLRSFSAKRQRTLRLSQDWMNTVARVSWLPFNSVPSTKISYSFLYDFYFVFVCWKIILGNFIISNGWYELDVRDSMSLSIDFRWIVMFVLKRNNFREFCVWSDWHDWYFVTSIFSLVLVSYPQFC